MKKIGLWSDRKLPQFGLGAQKIKESLTEPEEASAAEKTAFVEDLTHLPSVPGVVEVVTLAAPRSRKTKPGFVIKTVSHSSAPAQAVRGRSLPRS